MGDKGMHDMAEMEMPLPDNTLPMMTGTGPFGPVGMGGMFSVVKVRDDIQRGDFRDPGPYMHPADTLAREYTADLPETVRASAPNADANTLQVRKPTGHVGH
jgi:manganese oxidase